MKRLSIIFSMFLCMAAGAQVRTYSDNQSKTFVVGLENYFYGDSGSLDFKLAAEQFNAHLSSGKVSVNGSLLESGPEDTVIGIHDFTGDSVPEFVVARRAGGSVSAKVYTRSGGAWELIGKIGSKDASEIRVFRQVLSIRRGDTLCSWTWRNGSFDYKASDGSPEPVL